MSRGPMSDAHKAKLAAGREAKAKERQKVDDRVAQAWLKWVKLDAQLYQAYRQAVEFYESGKEVTRPYNAWMKHKQGQPPVPNDAAVKRVRGEA